PDRPTVLAGERALYIHNANTHRAFPTSHETVVAELDHHANIDPWWALEGPSDGHETQRGRRPDGGASPPHLWTGTSAIPLVFVGDDQVLDVVVRADHEVLHLPVAGAPVELDARAEDLAGAAHLGGARGGPLGRDLGLGQARQAEDDRQGTAGLDLSHGCLL